MSEAIRFLNLEDQMGMLQLLKQIYPTYSEALLKHRIQEIFTYANYSCWGYFKDDQLLAICGGWMTERLYCGKQLEIDNFIVDEAHRSAGIGNQLLHYIEDFAREQQCETIELNSYVFAGKSHKFYFRNNYSILGFHFEKKLK